MGKCAPNSDFVAWSHLALLAVLLAGGFIYRGTYFNDLLSGAYIFGDNTLK